LRKAKEWLAAELIDTCKQYRLAEASVILRMLLMIGEKQDRLISDTVIYLLNQQNSKGAFGFFVNDSEGSELLPVYLN